MAQTAFSIRMDEGLKRDFSQFCENIGMSMSTAFVVFAKAALRSRRIPFEIYDYREQATEIERSRQRAIEAFNNIRADVQGRPEMSMSEIDAEIARARKERRERKARKLKAAESV
jgi:addiction module RelB/DinJ family antitoxin